MDSELRQQLAAELADIDIAGLTKREREITTAQNAHIVTAGAQVINFCANNYLGLANHPDLVAAAHHALDTWGYGLASVRFICGTQSPHLELERRVAGFLGTDAAILYSSCFDANGAVFATVLDERDAVISDELNHASIIDGIRLCKAKRLRYRNRDIDDLRAQLEQAKGCRRILIVTDGVFSMDGYVAPVAQICELAQLYGALVMVDDSHAVGVVGPGGRGVAAAQGVADQVDIYTGTFGKALGGANGGYVAGREEIVALLRQRSRPYLFSNTVAPVVVGATLAALDLLETSDAVRQVLAANTARFRAGMAAAGFTILPGDHPIVPVMFGDARLAAQMADKLLELGIYVTAFSYPVVPLEQARIRVQVSAAHSEADIDRCVEMFVTARKCLTD